MFIPVPTVQRHSSKVHSFVTIDNRETIELNLRNVQKRPVFAQRLTIM